MNFVKRIKEWVVEQWDRESLIIRSTIALSEAKEALERATEQKEKAELSLESLLRNMSLNSAALAITRTLLASHSMKGISFKNMSVDERKDFVSKAAQDFNSTIRHVASKLLRGQEEYTSRTAANMDQLMFSRGTVNGIMLVIEEYEEIERENRENQKPKDEFNSRAMFPELDQ